MQQAIALVQPSGQPGRPCADTPGDACAVAGQVRGQGTLGAGGMNWSLTATIPPGATPGTVPVAVLSTTRGLEGFACSPVTVGATTVTCTGTTLGPALQGSTVTVVFTPGVAATGTVTGLGGRLAPPPPIILPPPPPAQLVPVPPVPGAALPTAPGSLVEVPVIPEADSLGLLAGGLIAVGVLVGLRAVRRRVG